jgi:hypothetical protein
VSECCRRVVECSHFRCLAAWQAGAGWQCKMAVLYTAVLAKLKQQQQLRMSRHRAQAILSRQHQGTQGQAAAVCAPAEYLDQRSPPAAGAAAEGVERQEEADAELPLPPPPTREDKLRFRLFTSLARGAPSLVDRSTSMPGERTGAQQRGVSITGQAHRGVSKRTNQKMATMIAACMPAVQAGRQAVSSASLGYGR